MRFKRLAAVLCGLTFLMAVMALPARAEEGWTSVREYLPESWPEDGSVDLHDGIQRALDEEPMLLFPGGESADDPLVYPSTAGLVVRKGCRVQFAPHARLLRLPSEGHMVTMEEESRLSGAVIDGNKYAHWPEFKELGKSDSGVHPSYRCVIEDCVVFNNPGIAFFTYGSYNKVYRCLAENTGYIDVKFGANFYQGKWDKWSGDGFYFRGSHNLVKDCEAYDCFRWGYVSSHSGARQNTYVDCRGGDVNWNTYGFIDIEGGEANNRLIRCVSPNSHIAIPGSPLTEVVGCVASSIRIYDAENPDTVEMYGGGALSPRIEGCITTRGGITVGGYSSKKGRHIPGAVAPVIVGNRMFKSHPGSTDPYSDWSFSVHSIDGNGTVAHNVLFEYEGPKGKGPGMNLDNIEGTDNQVVYGQNDLDLAKPHLRYGYVAEEYKSVLDKKEEDGYEKIRQKLYREPEEGVSLPGAGAFSVEFPPSGEDRSEFIPAYRVGWGNPEGSVLRGGGAVITKRRIGPGVYHARFMLDESHPKFAYHSYALLFCMDSVDEFDGSKTVARRTEYLALQWRDSGRVSLRYVAPPQKKGQKGAQYELGSWHKPGPSPETQIEPGEVVELSLKVPEPGERLEVYLNQADTAGEPDCTFTMPSTPRSGHFGFINYKWYSRVLLEELSYRPLE